MSFAAYGSVFVDGISVVPAGYLNFVRTSLQSAVDGIGGGTYALTAPLTFSGQLVTLDDLTLVDDLIVGDDATVGGDLGVTGAITGASAAVTGALTGASCAVTAALSGADLTASETVALSGIITPTALAANTDNWNPTDLANATIIRVSASSTYNLTGIVAPATNRVLVLVNVGANTITLINNNTSTAANRFQFGTAGNISLAAEDSVILWYDLASARWRGIATSL